MNRSSVVLVVLVVVLFASVIANIFFWKENSSLTLEAKEEHAYEANVKKYPLISNTVLRDEPVDVLINFFNLRNVIRQKVIDYKDKLAIYFEYLPTGTSIGVHEKDPFYAASLFKLPVVMAYFRDKERQNITTDKMVTVTQDMVDSRYGSLWTKGAGYQIGLEEASKLALTESDNTAAKVLGPYITEQDFKDVYDAIDIDLQITDKGAVMTPKQYSSILKALYFTSVLNNDSSEKILSYLTQTPFNDKLTASIPKGITVAHKIGVIDAQSYMDCGIVYVPRRPYVVCMVSTGDENDARTRISTVSKMIYDYVVHAKDPVGN